MLKVAIASGKGGTGKTFVATNLFKMMLDSGLRVGLVDCDAEVPNDLMFVKGELLNRWSVNRFCPSIDLDKCIRCGKCAESCLFHAITCIPALNYIKVMPDICHACKACLYACQNDAVIPGYQEVGEVTAYGKDGITYLYESRLKEGEHSPVPVIREAIFHAEQREVDYLIMDAPPGCACPFVNTVKDADMVILVTEPTPFGLSDLKHTVQVLRKLKKAFSVIINRSDLGDSQLKEYLAAENIDLLTEFPYSKLIAAAYSKGEFAVSADSKIQQSFACLMNNVLQYEGSRH